MDDALSALAADPGFDHPAHPIALQEMLQAERNASERLSGHIEVLVPD
ncbi:hypothetical protein KO516_11625 [Citreicella sp. C3M06]|nr:hypothetical protein [Citreicella sp. C3M06]MBU2961455.1 hypothetical protein [Citreicella sp. C3M06]